MQKNDMFRLHRLPKEQESRDTFVELNRNKKKIKVSVGGQHEAGTKVASVLGTRKVREEPLAPPADSSERPGPPPPLRPHWSPQR